MHQRDIVKWLAAERDCHVHHSAVQRFLTKKKLTRRQFAVDRTDETVSMSAECTVNARESCAILDSLQEAQVERAREHQSFETDFGVDAIATESHSISGRFLNGQPAMT